MSKKILIVEDEKSLREPLSKALKKEGFEVFEAENGEEGLDVAKKEHPNLILTDIVMPKMDGLSMLKELRKDRWGKNVHAIILTVLNEDKKVIDALQEGVYDYLIKSDWEVDNVVNKVKEKLNN